jgi:hypothetical protein
MPTCPRLLQVMAEDVSPGDDQDDDHRENRDGFEILCELDRARPPSIAVARNRGARLSSTAARIEVSEASGAGSAARNMQVPTLHRACSESPRALWGHARSTAAETGCRRRRPAAGTSRAVRRAERERLRQRNIRLLWQLLFDDRKPSPSP